MKEKECNENRLILKDPKTKDNSTVRDRSQMNGKEENGDMDVG